ncbi:MAG TPA: BON domain-containing protein [Pyrinomonadaceae bacterium]|jgi:osmotically-inducible protein OsmY
MKIRHAGGGALVLALALGAAACGKGDNANNTNAARNTNTNANTATAATPAATATPASASEDTAIKNKTEAALTKAGVTGVTVEVEGGNVTLKGEVPSAKFADAVKAANESGAKKVNNQLSKK